MARFETHGQSRGGDGELHPLTVLALETSREGDDYLVTLNSESEPERPKKVLYRGPSQTEQQRIYNETKKHYQQRAKDEA